MHKNVYKRLVFLIVNHSRIKYFNYLFYSNSYSNQLTIAIIVIRDTFKLVLKY